MIAAAFALLAYGRTSLDMCMAAAGRASNPDSKGWLAAIGEHLFPLLPYAFALFILATAAVKLARSGAVTLVAHLAIAPPLLLAAANFTPLSRWHQCDRTGCPGCDAVVMLLMVSAGILVLMLAISALMTLMNRNRRPSGFSR